jgi:hypothetical protein
MTLPPFRRACSALAAALALARPLPGQPRGGAAPRLAVSAATGVGGPFPDRAGTACGGGFTHTVLTAGATAAYRLAPRLLVAGEVQSVGLGVGRTDCVAIGRPVVRLPDGTVESRGWRRYPDGYDGNVLAASARASVELLRPTRRLLPRVAASAGAGWMVDPATGFALAGLSVGTHGPGVRGALEVERWAFGYETAEEITRTRPGNGAGPDVVVSHQIDRVRARPTFVRLRVEVPVAWPARR